MLVETVMSGERQFPVLWRGTRECYKFLERMECPKSIPWVMVDTYKAAWAAKRNHFGQTFECLAERGGLSPEELVPVLEGREFKYPMNMAAHERLVKRLIELVAEFRKSTP